MAPANAYCLVKARRYGGPRPWLLEAQLTMLRLKERWAYADPSALPWDARTVKEVTLIDADTFCVVSEAGHADAFAASRAQASTGLPSGAPSGVPNGVPSGGEGAEAAAEAAAAAAAAAVAARSSRPRWLADLRLAPEERVKMVSHLASCRALLVVFGIHHRRFRGLLYVRVLDVGALRQGDTAPRDCGTLSAAVVHRGGFVEVDEPGQAVYVVDGDTLRCWDAHTLEPRFVLGPWETGPPNVRFTHGFVALVASTGTVGADEGVEISLYGAEDGRRVSARDVPLPQGQPLTILELLGDQLLLKCEGSDASVLDLGADTSPYQVLGTATWDPEVFVFVPAQKLMLAKHQGSLEIWKVLRGPNGCSRIAIVPAVGQFQAGRFAVDARLGVLLLARPAPTVAPCDRGGGFCGVQGGGRGGLAKDCAGVYGAAASGGCGGAGGNASIRKVDDLLLLDLLRCGAVRAALPGPLDDSLALPPLSGAALPAPQAPQAAVVRGLTAAVRAELEAVTLEEAARAIDREEGACVRHMAADLTRGILVLLSRRGALAAYSASAA